VYGSQAFRSAIFVKLTDADGVSGWGESFANWPPFAAEHRARVVDQVLAPRAKGKKFESPAQLTQALTEGVAIQRIKSDERGPFDQAIAAVDIAAWDLVARRQRLPLFELLAKQFEPRSKIAPGVEVYASGLTSPTIDKFLPRARALGINIFKLKIGFDPKDDLKSVLRLRKAAGEKSIIRVDVDQAWTLEEAKVRVRPLENLGLEWIEEPLRADRPIKEWLDFAGVCSIPIAAGENIRGVEDFRAALASGVFSILQPDIIKWGGLTDGLIVAKLVEDARKRFCPHYLGGGIGLIATAHLLAAIGSREAIELDISENPLREIFLDQLPQMKDGRIQLSRESGLGIEPDLRKLSAFRIGI
jgi:L-alanine-DL-glutamate epimerase-like enolase superfamily enzyme